MLECWQRGHQPQSSLQSQAFSVLSHCHSRLGKTGSRLGLSLLTLAHLYARGTVSTMISQNVYGLGIYIPASCVAVPDFLGLVLNGLLPV